MNQDGGKWLSSYLGDDTLCSALMYSFVAKLPVDGHISQASSTKVVSRAIDDRDISYLVAWWSEHEGHEHESDQQSHRESCQRSHTPEPSVALARWALGPMTGPLHGDLHQCLLCCRLTRTHDADCDAYSGVWLLNSPVTSHTQRESVSSGNPTFSKSPPIAIKSQQAGWRESSDTYTWKLILLIHPFNFTALFLCFRSSIVSVSMSQKNMFCQTEVVWLLHR